MATSPARPDSAQGGWWVVSKFDLNGQLVASFGTGGTQFVDFGANAVSYAEAMGVDTAGNVFLAGATRLPPETTYSLAVAKIDAAGALVQVLKR